MAAAVMDKIQRIPSRTRVIVFLAFVGVLVVLYIWQVHIPKNTEIKRLEGEVAGLQAKIRENDEKIKRLDELKAEVKALHERLRLLTEQLPAGSEVSDLLRKIQNLVNQSGLSLKLWRPDRRRTHPSGLYEEIPIIMELSGGYHNVAMFFDRVSKMTRIVNMLNVRMTGARVVKAGVMAINISCTAMTFAAVEKKPDAAPAAKKVQ